MLYVRMLEKSSVFLESYQTLPRHIQRKVDYQLQVLSQNPSHSSLQVKKMADMGDIWEARVNYHYRFTFEWRDGVIYLRNLGSHDIYTNP